MQQMKAFVRTSAENLDVESANVGVPEINKDEALVAVKAFGVGVHDRYFIPEDAQFAYPIGIEGAGVVERIGGNVTNAKVGDRVMLSSSMQPKGGSWAEYVAVSSTGLVPMPEELDFTEGATLMVAGKTALESMHALDLKQGDTLFVAGASGAIGTLVIQMATRDGIRVAASASAKNHEYLRMLGAEKAVDYTSSTWKSDVHSWAPNGVDAALAIQPGTGQDSMDVVKDGGKVVSVSFDQMTSERDIDTSPFMHQLDMRAAIGALADDIVAGKVRTVIEKVYPFDDAIAALEKTETRHARGKLVVTLDTPVPETA